MLYVVVNKEQNKVFYATYDPELFRKFCKYLDVELQIRLFNDVEIYTVCE